jgi:orotate phosphoribosyltransferase-like protein
MDADMKRGIGVNFTKYRGKYIAIVDEKVVASGENAKAVLDRAKTKRPGKEIVLRKIPEEETLILVVGCG